MKASVIVASALAGSAMGAITIDNNQFTCTTGVSMTVGGGGSGGAAPPPGPPPYEPDPREFCGVNDPNFASIPFMDADDNPVTYSTPQEQAEYFASLGFDKPVYCDFPIPFLLNPNATFSATLFNTFGDSYGMYLHACEFCAGETVQRCTDPDFPIIFQGGCYGPADQGYPPGPPPEDVVLPTCAEMDAYTEAKFAPVLPLAGCADFAYPCTRLNDPLECAEPEEAAPEGSSGTQARKLGLKALVKAHKDIA